MKKSKRLKIVLRVDELAEQRQLLRLNTSRQQLAKQRELLGQLKDYRGDYVHINHAQLGADGSNIAKSVRELKNASRFMSELDQAVALQEHTEQANYAQWQEENAQWIKLRARRDTVDKLSEHYRALEAKEDEKRNDQDNVEVWLAARYYKK